MGKRFISTLCKELLQINNKKEKKRKRLQRVKRDQNRHHRLTGIKELKMETEQGGARPPDWKHQVLVWRAPGTGTLPSASTSASGWEGWDSEKGSSSSQKGLTEAPSTIRHGPPSTPCHTGTLLPRGNVTPHPGQQLPHLDLTGRESGRGLFPPGKSQPEALSFGRGPHSRPSGHAPGWERSCGPVMPRSAGEAVPLRRELGGRPGQEVRRWAWSAGPSPCPPGSAGPSLLPAVG